MAKRLTNTEKWKDAWFADLSKDEKLMFLYLQDNVDNAGFYEISFKHLRFDLDFSDSEISGAIKGLTRGLLGAESEIKKGDKIYLKNFLEHQKIKPLNPFNSYHLSAIKAFESNLDFVFSDPFLSNLKVYGIKKNKQGELIKTIDTNLSNYLNNNLGLESPLVKVIVKEEVEVKGKVDFGKSENLLELESLKREIEKEFTWRETLCRNFKEVDPNFNIDDFNNYLDQFFKQLENDGEESKGIQNTKKHFSRWLNIEIKKNNESNNNNKGGATESYKKRIANVLSGSQS